MPKQYLYAYLIVLLLVNISWALVPVKYEDFEQKDSRQEWVLSPVNNQNASDLQSLMKNEFWGQVHSSLSQSGANGTEVEVAAEEAKKLRAQVKAIIKNGSSKEVVFGTIENYMRIKQGDVLPDSQWILMDVGDDWLKLSDKNDDSKMQILKLFSGMGAAGVAHED